MTANDVLESQNQILRKIQKLKGGTLTFFGEWFGKPYDNFHKITCVAAEGNWLTIGFNAMERLAVLNPRDITADEKTFVIREADEIVWRWYSYGKAFFPENEKFMQFISDENGLRTRSTDKTNWRELPATAAAAVEIH